LHFRDDPLSPLAAVLVRAIQRFRWLDGIWGHDPALLNALEKTWMSLGRENPVLVITGDLTQLGTRRQLQEAAKWLSPTSSPTAPGLGVANWELYSVPGNHDQWPGRLPFLPGRTTKDQHPYLRYFASLFRISPQIAIGKHTLTLLGVNSDSGLSPGLAGVSQRTRAKGAFEKALDDLYRKLPPLGPDEIRVLLLHHSPTCPPGRVMSIEDASLAKLETFCRTSGISVILTGHTHTFGFPQWSGVRAPSGKDVLEVRCGTTTQVTWTSPWHAKQLGATTPFSQENGFMVHRIVEVEGSLEWRAEWWRFSPSTGMFRPCSARGGKPTRWQQPIWNPTKP
jgi:predicted phosphodiesterase